MSEEMQRRAACASTSSMAPKACTPRSGAICGDVLLLSTGETLCMHPQPLHPCAKFSPSRGHFQDRCCEHAVKKRTLDTQQSVGAGRTVRCFRWAGYAGSYDALNVEPLGSSLAGVDSGVADRNCSDSPGGRKPVTSAMLCCFATREGSSELRSRSAGADHRVAQTSSRDTEQAARLEQDVQQPHAALKIDAGSLQEPGPGPIATEKVWPRASPRKPFWCQLLAFVGGPRTCPLRFVSSWSVLALRVDPSEPGVCPLAHPNRFE